MIESQPISTADQLDRAIDLIVHQQTRPDRNVPSLATEREGIVGELAELTPPWASTAQVTCRGPTIVGAVILEWNSNAQTAWVHGPWLIAEDAQWIEHAEPLLRAAVEQVPTSIETIVMSGTIEHHLMRDLAQRVGANPEPVHYALVVPDDVALAWPTPPGPCRLRNARSDDLRWITALHDQEFPRAYFSATELLDRADNADHVIVVGILAPHRGPIVSRVSPVMARPRRAVWPGYACVRRSMSAERGRGLQARVLRQCRAGRARRVRGGETALVRGGRTRFIASNSLPSGSPMKTR